MTEQPAGGPDEPRGGRQIPDWLERAIQRARLTILWERLWPALVALGTAVGLFLALSWLGLWLWLPPMGRAVGLALFALLILGTLIPLLRLRRPGRGEALLRLDRDSGLAHRPATAVEDVLAVNPSDPFTQALWRAHLARVLAAARSLKPGMPAPHLARRDPMAVRALVLFLVVATFVAASGERGKRIAAALDWEGVVGSKNFRVDAWVTPPAYTGKPPIILTGLKPGEAAPARAAVLTVPAGSQLVVRGTGDVDLDVRTSGGLAGEKNDAKQPAATEERHFTIKENGSASVHGAGSPVTWNFVAIPDHPPVITLAKDPEPQARGSLLLAYKLEDDYGVTQAHAHFALRQPGKAGKEAHPLFDAPDFALSLPQARTRSGVGQTIKDLSEHPWAGAEVTLTLTARDEAGNEGQSAPHDFRLPERTFAKPLARALVEQRRILALDTGARPLVQTALDALLLGPERFTPEPGIYLGLQFADHQLLHAKSDDDLREVVASLWALALAIEDGNISDEEKALRAAQENLRQALERGASDEEIKKLTQDLRAALDKFLQALAEQMRKNPQQLARPLDPNTRMLRSQDLQSMIDRLERLARSGSKDAARQLLDQLQSMLENLQMAQPGQPGDQDMNSSMDELNDMIRKQQQLRDRTFQQGQNQRRDRQRGQNGQQSQMGQLQQDQKGLRDRLDQLMQQLRKRGLGQQQPGQQGQQGEQGQQGQQGQMGQQRQQGQQGQGDELGQAGEEMGQAEGQLGEGNADSAVDSQGRALDALRRGAQNLAQSMQQQPGMGQGPGRPGRNGQARADQETDPLGRPLHGRDDGDDVTVKVPGEIDVQRARRILEELRRRYADPDRSQMELDYIERLLKAF